MKIEHLRIFLEVAQSESINKAATKLFTSHQNLNVLLKKLEEELGTTLFLRSNKGIMLSDDGKELLEAAKQIVAIYDDFNAKIKKDTGIVNFYTSTSLASLVNDLQGCLFCNNYISVHKKNVDEIYTMLESKKKGIYFLAVTGDDIRKLEQHKDHAVLAEDSTAVHVLHQSNPILNCEIRIEDLFGKNPTKYPKPKIISNISQPHLIDDFLLNIDDLSISKKMMREGNFVFSTTESLYHAYFPEDEWVCIKQESMHAVTKFVLFFNLPVTVEWREARIKITEKIQKNFNL